MLRQGMQTYLIMCDLTVDWKLRLTFCLFTVVATVGLHWVLSEELAVDMISLAFIVELVVLFSGFPRIAVFVRPK
jgi:hypothetical protein